MPEEIVSAPSIASFKTQIIQLQIYSYHLYEAVSMDFHLFGCQPAPKPEQTTKLSWLSHQIMLSGTYEEFGNGPKNSNDTSIWLV